MPETLRKQGLHPNADFVMQAEQVKFSDLLWKGNYQVIRQARDHNQSFSPIDQRNPNKRQKTKIQNRTQGPETWRQETLECWVKVTPWNKTTTLSRRTF